MWSVIFSTDTSPLGVLSSGNTTLILAFIIVVMAGVIVWQSRKIDSKDKQLLGSMDARITDAKESRDTLVGPLELIGRQNDLILRSINGKDK